MEAPGRLLSPCKAGCAQTVASMAPMPGDAQRDMQHMREWAPSLALQEWWNTADDSECEGQQEHAARWPDMRRTQMHSMTCSCSTVTRMHSTVLVTLWHWHLWATHPMNELRVALAGVSISLASHSLTLKILNTCQMSKCWTRKLSSSECLFNYGGH